MKDALAIVGAVFLVLFVILVGLVLTAVCSLLIAAVFAAPFLGIALAILFPLHWFGVI